MLFCIVPRPAVREYTTVRDRLGSPESVGSIHGCYNCLKKFTGATLPCDKIYSRMHWYCSQNSVHRHVIEFFTVHLCCSICINTCVYNVFLKRKSNKFQLLYLCENLPSIQRTPIRPWPPKRRRSTEARDNALVHGV
jgi:hypothetical protein